MSKSIYVKLNRAGVAELMKSEDMKKVLREIASSKAQQAGPGFDSSVHLADSRAIANIYPTDAESAHENYENNTLLKVIGG